MDNYFCSQVAVYLRQLQHGANVKNGRDPNAQEWQSETVHFHQLLGFIADHFDCIHCYELPLQMKKKTALLLQDFINLNLLAYDAEITFVFTPRKEVDPDSESLRISFKVTTTVSTLTKD